MKDRFKDSAADYPEPTPPRPAHREYVQGEFGRFFRELYAVRWAAFAIFVVICLCLLASQSCANKDRIDSIQYRLDAVGAPR